MLQVSQRVQSVWTEAPASKCSTEIYSGITGSEANNTYPYKGYGPTVHWFVIIKFYFRDSMENNAGFYIMVYHVANLIFILLMYMSSCSGRDLARRNSQPWSPGYVRRKSTSTSSSTMTNPPTPPVSSATMASTAPYSFEPSIEQPQVALPVLIIAGSIVGIFLCGIALAINHLWRTRWTNETPVEEEQRVSSHKTLDWSLFIV